MRLVVWCVAFVLGDASALSERVGVRVAVAAGLTAVAALALRRPRAAAVAGWFALGLALGGRALAPPPLHPTLAAALESDDPVELEGEVTHGPELTGTGARALIALSAIRGAPAAGVVALSVLRGWPEFGPGARVSCTVRLRPLRGTRNPGLPDPMLGLRAEGVDALAGAADPSVLRQLAEPQGTGPRRAAFLARRALRGAIDRAVGGPAGAFLKTAVLGDRRGVGPEVEEGFRAAGATHVLSVSGLHLAAVATFFFLLVRTVAARVPGLPLWLDPRAIAAAAALPAIAFFTLLTGEAIATERSALMLAIAMGGLLVGRAASPGPAIAAAALVLLLAQPLELLDVSLQLSVASVAGIALLARRLGPRQPRTTTWLLRWLWRFGAATAAATAATAPLVAHHFGEIAPLAPFGNLALVPLVEMVIVPVGLVGAIAGTFWAPLGGVLLTVAGKAAGAALAIAEGFRAYAPLWTCRTPNGLETAALVAAGMLALAALSMTAGTRGRRARLATLAAAAAALALASLAARELLRRHAGELVITFLDVGQGDAAVVEAPGGAVILIDGGGNRDGQYDPGARIVEPFLRARGIGRLELVALSHPHPDHLNGLIRIVQRFPVSTFWSSGDSGANPAYGSLLELARARGARIPAVTPVAFGPARIAPLGPFVGDGIGAPEGLTVNDASLVLRVAFAGRAVLFAGDLEADGEGELAGRRELGDAVGADVLKVPHHGSRTSSAPELLDAVAPRIAVISLGWRNQFHFPAPEVLARYQARGVRVLRTDRDGAVTVRISPAGDIRIDCERGCPDSP